MMSAIDKRNFFLTMSALDGQRLAHVAGFAIPSEEVQQSEVLDVVRKWIIITSSGILDTIVECLDWTLEIVNSDGELSSEEVERTREVITSYSVAMVARLLDTHTIALDYDALEGTEVDVPLMIRTLFKLEDYDEQ